MTFLTFGQDYYTNTRRVGIEDGLPHHRVYSLYPEEDGMWVSTDHGLSFYDGYNWKQWTKGAGQLNYSTIKTILKDQDDQLWLINNKLSGSSMRVFSIDILDTDRVKATPFEDFFDHQAPFAAENIQHFFHNQNNELYFFTANQLWKYGSSKNFVPLTIPNGFVPHTIFPDGKLIGRLDNRLAIVSISGQLLHHFNHEVENHYYEIKGNSDKFWFWQIKKACYTVTKQAEDQYNFELFPLQPLGDLFSIMYHDNDKDLLWLGREREVFLYDTDGNFILVHNNIIPRQTRQDFQGNLWLGKYEIEVVQLQEKFFKRYLYEEDDDVTNPFLFQCRGIFKHEGKLWVTTYRGTQLVDLENGSHTPHTLAPEIVFNHLKDHQGNIWTAHRRVFQLDESGEKVIQKIKTQLEKPRIWSLFEDANHRIWCGHYGLAYIEDGKFVDFKQYNEFQELKDALILFIHQDKSGVIWLGSNKGLYQLDLQKGITSAFGENKEFTFYLPSNKVQHMYQDAQGIYWLATEDKGLLRWNNSTGEIKSYGTAQGFLSNNVYSVYEDNYNQLWLSTYNGLVCFNKSTERVKVYTKEDGISDNEFNRLSHYQAEDGHLFFGGQNGVTGFHPKDFIKKRIKSPSTDISVRYVSVVNKRILKDTLEDISELKLTGLEPGTKIITLEMASSNLFYTDKIHYHYTLEKLDHSRKVTLSSRELVSTDNKIELFGITPGTYNLRIKPIHKDGKILAKAIDIPIGIKLPFFHRPSFWISCVFLLIVGIWGLDKFRTAHLRKQRMVLQQLVKERTEEILSNRKTIQNQAEQIEVMKDQLSIRDQQWLKQFQSIVQDRLADPDLYLPDVIDEMDISRSVFFEKVKSLTQMTPNQYIQELRLNKAKTLLDEGSVKTVKETAQSVGIKRPAYFSKLFKERFGILPSEYFRNSNN